MIADGFAADCAAEPIRIPGAIQPHGALIVLDPETLIVRHASLNVPQVTGLALSLGRPLDAAPGAAALAADLRQWMASDAPALLRVSELPAARLQLHAHATPQGIIAEFEAPPQAAGDTLVGLYPRLRIFLDAISAATDVTAIAHAAVAEVRALTAFDRVLLYSFDGKGDGTVLAEDRNEVLPSYAGQRFPASDIPAQARELYKLNRIRLIPDAAYQPVPVEPVRSSVDGLPLDLSHAALRSVSPIHLEYMRNMGTGASMSISILVDGSLWGLITGHSRTPHGVNAQIRSACDIIGQILSLHIEARLQAQRTAERLALKRVETDLLARLAGARSLQSGLLESSDAWMALAQAQGAAVVTQDGVFAVGSSPPDSFLRTTAARLRDRSGQGPAEDVFATECLSDVWPEAAQFAATASGLLAIPISQIHADYVFWFRPEVVRTIDWSGDPTKAVEAGAGRLHPRKSFEIWRDEVRLRSLPWSATVVDSVRDFGSSVQSLVLRRAEERAELTDRLEQANEELESFSYSISHDLRAPFRHIVGYAELLADRERNLDTKSLHYLQTIKDAAIAAGSLVDDLLNFSQLGRTQLSIGSVDMSKLVTEVRRSLELETIGRRIDWRVGTLPNAAADPSMIRQVLQNLLQNAIKYSAPRETAEISITGDETCETTSYTVADNGVGFEMAYVDKLFGVFQRLHRVDEFEGTGIGLALVKRIIDRHGGRVEAYGRLGEGATFTFSLPKRDHPNAERHRG